VREDDPKAPFATAKEVELAAEALGVADAAYGAHGEPEGPANSSVPNSRE